MEELHKPEYDFWTPLRWIHLPSLQLLGVLLAFACMGGCGSSRSERSVQPFLDELTQEQGQRRDSLVASIPAALFLREDLPALHAAIQHQYPDDSLSTGTRIALLGVLENLHDNQTPEVISAILSEAEAYPSLQTAALRVLATIGTPPALHTFVSTISKNPAQQTQLETVFLPLVPDSSLQHLFPDFLATQLPPRAIYQTLAEALEQSPELVPRLTDSVGGMLQQYQQLAQSYRETAGSRRAESLETRDCIQYILKALAHYPILPEVNQLLTKSLSDSQPEIRLASLLACFDAQIPVSDSTLRTIAADFRIRNQLYQALNEQSMLARFPDSWKQQVYFAESDLANWLANPANSGHFPDQIELLELADSLIQSEAGRMFAFRFRYSGDSWRIGISGPQPTNPSEFVTSGFLTNSLYKTERQVNLEAHIRELIE